MTNPMESNLPIPAFQTNLPGSPRIHEVRIHNNTALPLTFTASLETTGEHETLNVLVRDPTWHRTEASIQEVAEFHKVYPTQHERLEHLIPKDWFTAFDACFHALRLAQTGVLTRTALSDKAGVSMVSAEQIIHGLHEAGLISK